MLSVKAKFIMSVMFYDLAIHMAGNIIPFMNLTADRTTGNIDLLAPLLQTPLHIYAIVQSTNQVQVKNITPDLENCFFQELTIFCSF